jgi:hypothetical protein
LRISEILADWLKFLLKTTVEQLVRNIFGKYEIFNLLIINVQDGGFFKLFN